MIQGFSSVQRNRGGNVADIFKSSLFTIFKNLDEFIEGYRRQEGGVPIERQSFRIVGQIALILADLPFPITATSDLDITTTSPYEVQVKLRELLKPLGIILDPDGRLIWMPPKTRYHPFYNGRWVEALYADPEDVILSKYKFGRADDEKLIRTYLEYYPGFRKTIDQSGLKRK